MKLHLGQMFRGGADGWKGSGFLRRVVEYMHKALSIRLDSETGYVGGRTLQKLVSSSQIPLSALVS